MKIDVVPEKYLNLVDGKIYEIVAQDIDGVTFRREGRGANRYLGRAEFDRRFQKQTAPPVTHGKCPCGDNDGLWCSLPGCPYPKYIVAPPSPLTATSDRDSEAVARIRTHVENHKNKPRAMFSIEGMRAVLAEIDALSNAPPSSQTGGEPIRLIYTNWRGETSERTIKPIRIWFGSTEWHPAPQWLLTAFDVEKGADRDFALKDFGKADLKGVQEFLNALCRDEIAAIVASRNAPADPLALADRIITYAIKKARALAASEGGTDGQN